MGVGARTSGFVYALSADSNGAVWVGSNRLSIIRPLAVQNQFTGSSSSLVAGTGGAAHLFYLDSSNDIMLKTYSGSPASWSAATTV
ncbi:MAG: two-component regulator propeller domain-containing protein, partial [bacterium]